MNPGIGAEPDPDALTECALERVVLEV